ncbi:MAG: inorganic diphosphatase [Pseudomonadota bacterium]
MLRLDALALGHAPPDDINVLVTSRSGAEPIALAWDAPTGALTVSQLFHTTMRAPGNLGIIPRTQGENGEPLQALVVTSHEVPSGIVLPARPIGVVIVQATTSASPDVTVVALPSPRLTRRYDPVATYRDLPAGHLKQLEHFLTHYRDLEEPSREPIAGWGDLSEAKRIILEAAERIRGPRSYA